MKIAPTVGLALLCVLGLATAYPGYPGNYHPYGSMQYGSAGIRQGGFISFVFFLLFLVLLLDIRKRNGGTGGGSDSGNVGGPVIPTTTEPPIVIINFTR